MNHSRRSLKNAVEFGIRKIVRSAQSTAALSAQRTSRRSPCCAVHERRLWGTAAQHRDAPRRAGPGRRQPNQLKTHKSSRHLTAVIWSQLGRSGFKVGARSSMAALRIRLRTCLSSRLSAPFGQAPLMPSTACAKPSVQAWKRFGGRSRTSPPISPRIRASGKRQKRHDPLRGNFGRPIFRSQGIDCGLCHRLPPDLRRTLTHRYRASLFRGDHIMQTNHGTSGRPPVPSAARAHPRWLSPAIAVAVFELRDLAPRLSSLLYVSAIPDTTVQTILDWSEEVSVDAGRALAFDRLRAAFSRFRHRLRRRAHVFTGRSGLNRPGFTGGSRVSMDGAYGKRHESEPVPA